MNSPAASQKWHIASWPPLAWVETVIKGLGQILGIIALIGVVSGGGYVFPDGVLLFQVIAMALLALGLTIGIGDRFRYREIISMVFIVINNFAHWGIVLAMLAGMQQFLIPFAVLFLVGDIVKLIFIRIHRFTVGDYPQSVIYGLTLFYVIGYAVVLGLEIFKSFV